MTLFGSKSWLFSKNCWAPQEAVLMNTLCSYCTLKSFKKKTARSLSATNKLRMTVAPSTLSSSWCGFAYCLAAGLPPFLDNNSVYPAIVFLELVLFLVVCWSLLVKNNHSIFQTTSELQGQFLTRRNGFCNNSMTLHYFLRSSQAFYILIANGYPTIFLLNFVFITLLAYSMH
jgi:hypothetical protein